MTKRYIILASILVLLSVGLLILPERSLEEEISPNELLSDIYDQSRYLTTDQVASRIINDDPSLFLIDVRTVDLFEDYSIPGAVNIPLDEILLPEWEDYLVQEGMDIVFYSNSDLYAEQVWIICKRLEVENIYVMKGGLNTWFNTIILPSAPDETEGTEAFDLYQFRKGASLFFGGSSPDMTADDSDAEPVIVTRKKKETVVEGGC